MTNAWRSAADVPFSLTVRSFTAVVGMSAASAAGPAFTSSSKYLCACGVPGLSVNRLSNFLLHAVAQIVPWSIKPKNIPCSASLVHVRGTSACAFRGLLPSKCYTEQYTYQMTCSDIGQPILQRCSYCGKPQGHGTRRHPGWSASGIWWPQKEKPGFASKLQARFLAAT